MARVTGIGGVFFKARDAETLRAWYRTHLGLEIEDWGGVTFRSPAPGGERGAVTVWTIFPSTSTYFAPSAAPFMINYRVTDLALCWLSSGVRGARWTIAPKSRSLAASGGWRIRRVTG